LLIATANPAFELVALIRQIKRVAASGIGTVIGEALSQ